MSEEALGFVDEWISEHVRPGEHTSDDNNTQAKALAKQCLADASAEVLRLVGRDLDRDAVAPPATTRRPVRVPAAE